jgi:hypothetical protein
MRPLQGCRDAENRSRRKFGFLCAVAVLLSSSCSASSSVALSGAHHRDVAADATDLLTRVIANAVVAKGLDYVETSETRGRVGGVVNGHVGQSSGLQKIADGKAVVVTRVVGTTCYVSGDRSLLRHFGVPGAAKLAPGDWIAVGRGRLFDAASDLITLPTVLAHVTPAPPLRLAASHAAAARLSIEGSTPQYEGSATGHAVLVVDRKTMLPVSYTWRAVSGNHRDSWTFAHWNVPVAVAPPPAKEVTLHLGLETT